MANTMLTWWLSWVALAILMHTRQCLANDFASFSHTDSRHLYFAVSDPDPIKPSRTVIVTAHIPPPEHITSEEPVIVPSASEGENVDATTTAPKVAIRTLILAEPPGLLPDVANVHANVNVDANLDYGDSSDVVSGRKVAELRKFYVDTPSRVSSFSSPSSSPSSPPSLKHPSPRLKQLLEGTDFKSRDQSKIEGKASSNWFGKPNMANVVRGVGYQPTPIGTGMLPHIL